MSETPKLVLNRNYVLATTKGHSIAFEKGVPTHVPPSVYAEAIAIGATPDDGSDPNVLLEDTKKSYPTDPLERKPLITAALEKIVADNERTDFTAAGSPTVAAITREVGFNVSAAEIATAWQAYHDAKAAQ